MGIIQLVAASAIMQTMLVTGFLVLVGWLHSAMAHFPHGFLRPSFEGVEQLPDDDPYLFFCCTTAPTEFKTEVMLNVTRGAVPKFLQGDWIKMAGAKFEMGHRQVGHGFDAFAKLHKFRFLGNGNVAFSAQFLGSKFYNESVAAHDIVPGLLMGAPVPSFQGLDYAKAFMNIADNTLINPWAIGEDSFVTTTDFALYNEFDRTTLEPRGWFPMEDSFGHSWAHWLRHYIPAFTGSHTQYIGGGNSPSKGRTSINWLGELSAHVLDGIGMDFTVYRQRWGSRKREAISQTLRLDWVPVIHSFGITSEHAIFLVHPLKMDLMSAMGSKGPSALASVKWDPSEQSKVLVLNLAGVEADTLPSDLAALQVFELSAFFSVHHMNTYEEDGKLITQCACYSDGDFFDPNTGINFMAVERDPSKRIKRGGDLHFCQIEVDLLKGTVVNKRQPSGRGVNGEIWGVEMPRYNEQWQGRKNCYFYGVAAQMNKTYQKETKFKTAFAKTNLCIGDVAGNIITYAPELQYAWEPIFVPNGGPAEDDGILLVVSMDGDRKTSYLLILDAKDMTKLAVIYLPEGFIIPNGLHSRFFPYSEFPLPSAGQTVTL